MVCIGLVASPALLSIGTGMLPALFLLQRFWTPARRQRLGIPPGQQRSLRISVLGVLLLFLLELGSGLVAIDTGKWLSEVRLALPLLLVPPLFWHGCPWGGTELRRIFGTLVLAVIVVGGYSLLHYALHYAAINDLVARSKELPIVKFGSNLQTLQEPYISHIYFSLLNAVAVFAALALAATASQRWRWLWGGLALVLLAYLHVFTGRTGLLAFYAGAALLLVRWLLVTRGRLKILAGLVAGGGLLLALAWYTVPSFQQRVHLAEEDWRVYNNWHDVSGYSLARRLVAYQMAWRLTLDHPVTGVGFSNTEAAMEAAWQLQPRRRVRATMWLHDPHNQYLEWLLGGGFLFGGLAIAGFLYPLVQSLRHKWWLALVLGSVLFTGMFFETLLERHVGVSFYTLLWLLVLSLPAERPFGSAGTAHATVEPENDAPAH